MELTLSERARRILEKLEPAPSLGQSIEALAADAIRSRLRRCGDGIGAFEAPYGRMFEEFAADWQAGRVPAPHSHAVERDYMEWEALVMERKELLGLIRELAGPSGERAITRSGA